MTIYTFDMFGFFVSEFQEKDGFVLLPGMMATDLPPPSTTAGTKQQFVNGAWVLSPDPAVAQQALIDAAHSNAQSFIAVLKTNETLRASFKTKLLAAIPGITKDELDAVFPSITHST